MFESAHSEDWSWGFGRIYEGVAALVCYNAGQLTSQLYVSLRPGILYQLRPHSRHLSNQAWFTASYKHVRMLQASTDDFLQQRTATRARMQYRSVAVDSAGSRSRVFVTVYGAR